MKIAKLVFALAAVASFAALAAYKIGGVDSMAVGNSAGYYSLANRTTVVGPGAGAYMQYGDSNLFFGAAAGLAATNVFSTSGIGHYSFRVTSNNVDCVGVGDLSFARSHDMRRCVGIGKGAFANTNGMDHSTWINDHVVVDGNGGIFVATNYYDSIPQSEVTIKDVDGNDVLRYSMNDTGTYTNTTIRGDVFIDNLYLLAQPYLRRVNGVIHVYIGNTDLGTLTLGPATENE